MRPALALARRSALGLLVALVAIAAPPPLAAGESPPRVASLNLTADELLVEMLPPERLVAVAHPLAHRRKEAFAGTVGVLVIVAVITAALSVMDLVLGQAMRWILP